MSSRNSYAEEYKSIDVLTFYRVYERLNSKFYLKYGWFLVVNFLVTCETAIIIGPVSLPAPDFARFGLRFFLRFSLPICLWCALERLARQLRCCYHTDCRAMSIRVKQEDLSSLQMHLWIDILLAVGSLVTFILFLVYNGIPGRDELENTFPKELLRYVYIADGSCLIFIAGQIQLTIVLMVFEVKYACQASCPDTTVKRWSRIKGTIVVTTLGVFASAFARLFSNKQMGNSGVVPGLNWRTLAGGGIIFLSTHTNRILRLMAVIVVLTMTVWGDVTMSFRTDLAHSSMHLGACGMLYNMISGGNALYLWSDRFKNILYQLLAVTFLAVIAADLQH